MARDKDGLKDPIGPLRTSILLPLLRSAAVAVPVFAGALLIASGFFTSWDGNVVAVAAPDGDDPATIAVVIANGPAERRMDWPADVVRRIDPAARPHTVKRQYSVSYTVEGVPGAIATTSPQAVGIAALAGLLAAVARNMVMAGIPWKTETQPRVPLPQAPPSGVPVPPVGPRSKPGPPPPGRSVGRGRR